MQCFYDTATSALCTRLVGLTEIVTTMDYYGDPNLVDKGWLVFGDMGGYVLQHIYGASLNDYGCGMAC